MDDRHHFVLSFARSAAAVNRARHVRPHALAPGRVRDPPDPRRRYHHGAGLRQRRPSILGGLEGEARAVQGRDARGPLPQVLSLRSAHDAEGRQGRQGAVVVHRGVRARHGLH
eukprot:2987767-Prymnesium_polylepis.1